MSAVKGVLEEFADSNASTIGSVMSGAVSPPTVVTGPSEQSDARYAVLILDAPVTTGEMQMLGKLLGAAGYHGVFQAGKLAEQMYVQWVAHPPSHTNWKWKGKKNG